MRKFEFSWKRTNINYHIQKDSFWFLTGRTLKVLTLILTEVSDGFMMSLENSQTFLSSLTKTGDSPPGMQFVEDSEQGQQRSRISYDALLDRFVKQLNLGKFQFFFWSNLKCPPCWQWALFYLNKVLLMALIYLDDSILSRYVTPPVSLYFIFFNNHYLPASFTWVTPKAASRTWNIADSAALPPEYLKKRKNKF